MSLFSIYSPHFSDSELCMHELIIVQETQFLCDDNQLPPKIG